MHSKYLKEYTSDAKNYALYFKCLKFYSEIFLWQNVYNNDICKMNTIPITFSLLHIIRMLDIYYTIVDLLPILAKK